jgi:hypothetical protein
LRIRNGSAGYNANAQVLPDFFCKLLQTQKGKFEAISHRNKSSGLFWIRVYTKTMFDENQKPAEVRAGRVRPRHAVPKAPSKQARTPEIKEDDLRRFKLSNGLWL